MQFEAGIVPAHAHGTHARQQRARNSLVDTRERIRHSAAATIRIEQACPDSPSLRHLNRTLLLRVALHVPSVAATLSSHGSQDLYLFACFRITGILALSTPEGSWAS
jgi:hypothetical protein